MKRIVILILVLAVLVAGALTGRRLLADAPTDAMTLAAVTRGDLVNTVSCSGTLNPVGKVEVGTQISGTIASLLVDYNDEVAAGDLLAVLDTVSLKAAVLEAEASVQRESALLDQARTDRDRNRPLFEQGLLGEAEFLPLEYGVRTQEAALKSARAGLTRARTNLAHAVIRSPIDGTVIQRAVEEGQTVAASMATPLLFLIAEDLTKMEILAQVDESDIGMIAPGQAAVFTVQTYPDREYAGTVQQIRLQPEVVQNVVTYTVVVDVANDDGSLLPGMTATVDFVVEECRDALLVPSAALRVRPTETMLAAAQALRARRQAARGGAAAGPAADAAGVAGNESGGRAMLWVVDASGEVLPRPARTGATDGKNTQILFCPELAEGEQVVVGVGAKTASASAQPRGMGMGMGPGRPPF